MKKLYLIAITVILLVPSLVFAVSSGDEWNDDVSLATENQGASNSSNICSELFKGDPHNIFRETFCSLMNLSALSISDFSTNLTCTIQQTGNEGNYNSGITFTPDDRTGKCITTASLVQISPNASTELTRRIMSGSVLSSFQTARSIMAVLALAFLIFLAFAHMLHIDINTYSIKKMLPMFLVGLVGGWFSIYIVYIGSVFIDFLLSLSVFSPTQTLHPMFNIFSGYLGNQFFTDTVTNASTQGPTQSINMVFEVGKILTGRDGGPSFAGGFLGSIMLLVPAVVVFLFEYVLALRPFVISLLAIISPFAFASVILPQTQFIFKKWWIYLGIALIYAPIVNLVFYVMNQIADPGGSIMFMSFWAVKIAMIVLLIRLPFTIESDLKKLGSIILKTNLKSNFVSGKGSSKDKKTDINEMQLDKTLKNEKTQGLFAPVKFSQKTPKVAPSQRSQVSVQSAPDIRFLKNILRDAHNQNLNRPINLLTRSASELDNQTVSKVINNSDLKIWKDKEVVDKLKTKDGQVLDEAGAALRADSTRKLVRLAQITENGKISNPEAIKFMSQKKLLKLLPLHILKRSYMERIIGEVDLKANFPNNYDQVINRFNSKLPAPQEQSPQIAKKLMEKDQNDSMSGFADIKKDLISKSVSAGPHQTAPEASSQIYENIKKSDKNAMDEYGLYYLNRISDVKSQSQSQIADILKNNGVNQQTAGALAKNPNLGLQNVSQYAPNMNDTTKEVLRQNLMARDIADSLSDKISSNIKEEKILIQKGIAQKIQENLKGQLKIDDIKADITTTMNKLEKPLSPEQTQQAISDINRFYPGATIKTNGNYDQEDITKVKKKGQSILETITTLQATGADRSTDRIEVDKSIENQVNSNINKVAEGAIKVDSAFSASLNESQNATT